MFFWALPLLFCHPFWALLSLSFKLLWTFQGFSVTWVPPILLCYFYITSVLLLCYSYIPKVVIFHGPCSQLFWVTPRNCFHHFLTLHGYFSKLYWSLFSLQHFFHSLLKGLFSPRDLQACFFRGFSTVPFLWYSLVCSLSVDFAVYCFF